MRSQGISLFRRIKTNRKRILIGSVVFGLSFIVIIFLFIGLVGLGVFGKVPSYERLKHIENPQASIVYGVNEDILGKYFIQNRTNVTFDEISTHIVDALIATEDQRFYNHHGIDWLSWGRVFIKTILLQQKESGGGSTITQQLAKNLFPRSKFQLLSLPINKIKEIWTAGRIEKVFSKEDILTMYLNTVSFGGTTYGIKSVCRQLFNQSPQEVSIEDAALIIGMLKATTFYHPRNDSERSMSRRNVVIHQMAKAGYLNEVERDSICAIPIQMEYVDEGHFRGTATYFREMLRQECQDIINKYNDKEGMSLDLYRDGLKIYTTVNPIFQKAAEAAVAKRMKKLQSELDLHWGKNKPWLKGSSLQSAVEHSERYKSYQRRGYTHSLMDSLMSKPVLMKVFSWEGDREVMMSPLDSIKYYLGLLQAGMLTTDPNTGAIKAWVGGIDHQYFKYDHVLSKRQPGSIFKPVVYSRALQMGYFPCDYLDNELVTYVDHDEWTPQNANQEYGGLYSLQGALSHSINTITVRLAMEGGIDSIRNLAYRMGITNDLPKVPSISLGTGEVSLFDMVQLYSTIANRGRIQPLYFIDRIETPEGHLIYKHLPAKSIQVIDPLHANLLTHMLQNTIENGTARSIRSTYNLKGDIAGKTGTTQSHTDGWFIGYTPQWVTGVWVGGDNPLVRFSSLKLGQGAHMALPIWAYYYQNLIREKQVKQSVNNRFEALPYEWRDEMFCDDFIDDYYLPWQRKLDEVVAREQHPSDRDQRNSRNRRKRRKDNNESKLESFFKKLFKKRN